MPRVAPSTTTFTLFSVASGLLFEGFHSAQAVFSRVVSCQTLRRNVKRVRPMQKDSSPLRRWVKKIKLPSTWVPWMVRWSSSSKTSLCQVRVA